MTERRKIQSKSQSDCMGSLPPILLDRIRLCSFERQVPPEIPLMVALAAIATSAGGAGIEIISGTRRTTRANLFVLLGVSSGVGKSEVFRDMLEPVLSFEAALHRWWEEIPAVKARAGEELLKARVSDMRTEIRKLHTGRVTQIFKILEKAERLVWPAALIANLPAYWLTTRLRKPSRR